MKLLGLSGSLRAGSGNTALLHAFAATAPDGFDVEVFDGLGDLPLFSPDKEADTPQSVLRLAARVAPASPFLAARVAFFDSAAPAEPRVAMSSSMA